MLEIKIPGAETLRLEHLVADFNGTLACDGILLPGVREAFDKLAGQLTLHVLTGDTFGTAKEALAGLPVKLVVLEPLGQSKAKRLYVDGLGAPSCIAIGNGRNDRLMIEAAGLGIAVTQGEGAAVETLLAADIATPNIAAALGLLLHSQRLIAGLRA